MENKTDLYKKSRVLGILEAAFEYFVAILVGGTFFAKLSSAIGLSDTLTGILSSALALASSFQIVAIFLTRKKRVKHTILFLDVCNQLLFAALYLVPGIKLDPHIKTALFVSFMLGGSILLRIGYAPKINWYMSLVDNHRRGRYTATKELVSLISGMIFTLVMGRIIDFFEAKGDLTTAFTLNAVVILVLMLLHTLTLIFTKEKERTAPILSPKDTLASIIKNKPLLLVIAVPMLYRIATGLSISFFGTYWNNDLGFSMTFNAVLATILSISRALFTGPFGRFADKHSFAKLLTICFVLQAVALLIHSFARPGEGSAIPVILYHILYGIAMAGINSGEINLIYDYVDEASRTSALAIKETVCGLLGFLSTLLMAIPIARIQENGNKVFGLPIYAQQLASVIGCLLVLVIVVYLNVVIKKLRITGDSDSEAA